MSTNVKSATRKGLLPDYHSILAIIFNIIHVFFSKTFLFFLFSLQHGGQIRNSSCVTSHESGLYLISTNQHTHSIKFFNTNPFHSKKLRSLCGQLLRAQHVLVILKESSYFKRFASYYVLLS